MLRTVYDLAFSPPTFDIVAFLSAIEQHRLKRREDSLAIEILPGPAAGFRDDKFWPYGRTARCEMLGRVAAPMAHMLPSAKEITVHGWERPKGCQGRLGHLTGMYGLRVHVAALREGIRPLRAPLRPVARKPHQVSITLREAEHWPDRNSNTLEWCGAARLMAANGFDVVVVRDAFRTSQPLDGPFAVNREAATDLAERAQLYSESACNLFVNNGPAWFAIALDAPALILKPFSKQSRTATPSYFRQCGIEPGQQIPGSPSYQRIAWGDEDSEAAIMAAFDWFMGNSAARLVS